MTQGPLNLITDVAGLRVGNASDDALNSGVTVLSSDAPFTAGISVMGGAPGTRETDLLAPDKTVQQVNALVLAGGSAFGLAAADGVSNALRAAGKGFAVGPHVVPIVPAAIIFDLGNGDQSWTDNPYPGSASLLLPSGHMVGALVVVNALGTATVDESAHFHAAPCELDGEFGGLGPKINTNAAKTPATKLNPATATTIAIVARRFDLWGVHRRQAPRRRDHRHAEHRPRCRLVPDPRDCARGVSCANKPRRHTAHLAGEIRRLAFRGLNPPSASASLACLSTPAHR